MIYNNQSALMPAYSIEFAPYISTRPTSIYSSSTDSEFNSSSSGNITVSGKVTNLGVDAPLSTVLLIERANGIVVAKTISDSNGEFSFSNIRESEYYALAYDLDSGLSPRAVKVDVIDQYIEPLSLLAGHLCWSKLNVPYESTPVVVGGTPPYTFSLVSGSLPPSFSLDAITGRISGTPTSLANTEIIYSSIIRATDQNSNLIDFEFVHMTSVDLNPGLCPSDINYNRSSREYSTTNTGNVWRTVRSSTGKPRNSGKWYFEFENINVQANSMLVGIHYDTSDIFTWPGNTAPNGVGIQNTSPSSTGYPVGQVGVAGLSQIVSGSTINVAIDLDLGRLWFGVNGAFFGNPETNTSPSYASIPSGVTTYAALGLNGRDGSAGQTAKMKTREIDFLYTPPTGFLPLED